MTATVYNYSKEEVEDGSIEYTFYSEVTKKLYKVIVDPTFYADASDFFPHLLVGASAISIFSSDNLIASEVDENVKGTIIALACSLIQAPDHEKVLIYQYDTSDGQEDSRNKLFHRWFEAPGVQSLIVKSDIAFDVPIPDDNTTKRIYMGFMTSKDNPKAQKVHDEFEEFVLHILRSQ
jgi:Family of unknown function (DUF6169)